MVMNEWVFPLSRKRDNFCLCVVCETRCTIWTAVFCLTSSGVIKIVGQKNCLYCVLTTAKKCPLILHCNLRHSCYDGHMTVVLFHLGLVVSKVCLSLDITIDIMCVMALMEQFTHEMKILSLFAHHKVQIKRKKSV